MSSKNFETGDVVQLKSGSPKMTVDFYNNAGDVVCSYFLDGERKKEVFPEKALQKVED